MLKVRVKTINGADLLDVDKRVTMIDACGRLVLIRTMVQMFYYPDLSIRDIISVEFCWVGE